MRADRIRAAKPVDVAALSARARNIAENGEMGEELTSLVGKLKEALEESGDYAGVIEVLMELPRGARLLALMKFRGVISPLRAEDELAGRLRLVTEVTGIEARSNGLVPDFFSRSSALLPELRRTGIKDPANLAMLGPVYLDLAQTRPDAVLGELEQDRALWDTGLATERVVESLLASDSRNAGTLIEALPSSPTKDTAIVTLCRWMNTRGEGEGIPAWIELVGQEKLKEELSNTYLNSGPKD
ncbi:hypothetical protein [Luteolibacter marinus]|uniref:hypothetical protein n=1 Tax=Luteolibacter marinus TaxID=2776705 RepID=UPI001D00D0A8|nr:hypothetical protein [Luteolibacter marinus]